MPVDFEASESWSEQLVAAGFDSRLPAVVVSTGVTMYLTKDSTAATLRQLAGLAAGSTLAMDVPSIDRTSRRRRSLRASESGARAAGTPFISFYTPPEMLTLTLARQAGFGGHYLSAVSCDGTAGHLSR
ncbi:class I SAM-dependent methyltransferase [Rhodococcus sp. IEGM 1305]|uniref:class I SAM-dependent methyltransferase n=1 Tax=Rhodococcus sp. IEGM 1305 TaxID=3047092 RepID=UPI0024B85D7E|nr:class I SAM-dependent methyltransferase [Rhodococcus sp. IEGM 1305]MDI9949366.1 class I SAM-dependent methyltransferase [Rhodococcus sp. IEGM 1305]